MSVGQIIKQETAVPLLLHFIANETFLKINIKVLKSPLYSWVTNFQCTLIFRTKALSKEKKRTDTLLYQMLPKEVAEQLKQNQEVSTEEFVQATIMFSDIVGFTNISSRSSPLQVYYHLIYHKASSRNVLLPHW